MKIETLIVAITASFSFCGCGYVKNIGDPDHHRDFFDVRDSETVQVPVGNSILSKEEAVGRLQGYFMPLINKKTQIDESLTIRVSAPMGVLDTLTAMKIDEAEAQFTFHYSGGYYDDVISRAPAGRGMERVTYRRGYSSPFDYEKNIPFRQVKRIQLVPYSVSEIFPTINSWEIKLDYTDDKTEKRAPRLVTKTKSDAQAIAEAISTLAR